MPSDSQGDSIVFNIKCSDDQEVSYIHRPGRTSWRYLHNLLRSGLADSRDVDLSPYITSRGVKILERIFGCPHPISSIRSPVSGTKLSLVYWTLSDIQYLPKLNSQDFDAMVDCVEHCELLDIRYSGFEQIESESAIAMEEAMDGQYTEWIEIIQPLTECEYEAGSTSSHSSVQSEIYSSYASLYNHYIPLIFVATADDERLTSVGFWNNESIDRALDLARRGNVYKYLEDANKLQVYSDSD